jgi:hypothetical protein
VGGGYSVDNISLSLSLSLSLSFFSDNGKIYNWSIWWCSLLIHVSLMD